MIWCRRKFRQLPLLPVFVCLVACSAVAPPDPPRPTAARAATNSPPPSATPPPAATNASAPKEAAVVPTATAAPAESTAVPTATPTPDLAALANAPFLMPIDGVFTIRGRGTVVTGTVERGTLVAGSEVEILGLGDGVLMTTVTSMEQFSKLLDTVGPGATVGLLLRGVKREDILIGQVVAAPGSIGAQRSFEASIRVLTREEGGRNSPFFPGYRPQFRLWTAVVTGEIALGDREMLMPGEEAVIAIELIQPTALDVGTTFEVVIENDHTVGVGEVTAVLD